MHDAPEPPLQVDGLVACSLSLSKDVAVDNVVSHVDNVVLLGVVSMQKVNSWKWSC